MRYEIYCAYHSNVDPEAYGDQFDRPIFVKLGNDSTLAEVPRCLDLQSFRTFRRLGKEYAETEMLLNLYWADMAELWKPPDYVGFVHYDMSWRGAERPAMTVSDYLDHCQLGAKKAVAFQPYDGGFILQQPGIEWVMELSRLLYATTSGTLLNRPHLGRARVSMCNAFVVHQSVFRRLCKVLSAIYESKELARCDVSDRIAGGVLERVAALHLFAEGLELIEFPLSHGFVASHLQDNRLTGEKS